ncbi:polysaccharide pyruvyl transferase family protein [Cytophagaceae bacterium ABcell3]|nr:polysaccharide pyruvyl transferase family protein [Cytophagaceae bacterium ABcell3]
MDKKTIEITGTNFHNKGAELMLQSVVKTFQPLHDQVRLAVHGYQGSYEQKADLKLYSKAVYKRFRNNWLNILNLVPENFLLKQGLTTDKLISAYLDASGFAYTDQFPESFTKNFALKYQKEKKAGKKVILLPQAFGPFTKQETKKHLKILVDSSDLVFARDIVSYNNIIELTGEQSKVKIAPDFTNLTEGLLPENFNIQTKSICIVPNQRMLDKTSKEESKNYIKFISTCIELTISKGYNPFFLVHETSTDLALAEKIKNAVKLEVEIVKESNPIHIKGIIQNCDAVIGSRFHGLVAALSQGVPAIASGWSHKYNMLFKDYDCEELILTPSSSEQNIKEKIDLITDKDHREMLIKKLKQKSNEQKELTRKMWQDVFNVLGVV